MRKSRFLIALILTLGLAPSGCGNGASQSEAASGAAASAPEISAAAQAKTAKLWPGTVSDSLLPFFKTTPWKYHGALTVEILAEGLSKTTGLDYFVTAKKVANGISVDWAGNSTLIAGLGDRPQKDNFHFYDADSMRWFMMDSLLLTINDNMAPENVYYTMNGGKELAFGELDPVNKFPADQPYMGSNVYLAPARGSAISVGNP